MEFIHLHNHTHYSLLDAICEPLELIKAAKADGQRALAITDHGVMFGCYEFYKKSNKEGIKPILGFEAYIANGSRHEKISGKAQNKSMRNYFHLVLLAKDYQGYKNLMNLTTLGHTEGFYYKPRIDFELLEKYHEGVVALSACIAGVINPFIVAGKYDEAKDIAQKYKDLFGEDFYIELQNHNLPEDEIILRDAVKIARQLDIPIIATNDAHYLKKEHAVAHNVFLSIRDATAANSGQFDIQTLRYRSDEMYFKTQQQMLDLFADYPDAIANTSVVADKCNIKFENKIYMPEFQIPKESTAENLDEYLRELTYQGLRERFGEIPEEVKTRADYELDVIINMKFPGYFLIVADFMQAAGQLGVRVGPGRGSAAGSIVAYALRITNVNPIEYDLLFERFLNPERVSMPDIDIDFQDDKRDLIIDYVKKKYGEQSVAQIITFGSLLSKAVLTDVGRVLGVPLTTIKAITAKIPTVRGKVTPLKEAFELPDLKWVRAEDDPKLKELINFALILEGKVRSAGTHAAGVIIAPKEVVEFVPLYQPPKQKAQGVDITTQYTMKDIEDAGLLKMDFLGLKTLSIIDNTLKMIKNNYELDIDIEKIDFADSATFDLLSEGNTLAVFQFESSGMQDYLKRLKPRNLEELTAMNALYRPGPMDNIPDYIDRKFGRKPIEYLDPIMAKAIKNTYGIIVYQEQVMQLCRDIAGFSLGQADILRRAMAKKNKAIMDEQKPIFVEGARKNSIEQGVANEIFDLIYKFADYGFNKSHSLAYSYLAFQTAWLKTHYPAEFLAANMTSEMNDQDKVVQLIEEAKKFKIQVKPPDINKSSAYFVAENGSIYFGMAAIKNVGVSAVDSIVASRIEKPFTSFFDFVKRVDTRLINKRALEALVCGGAFDSLRAGHRAALLASIETALDYAHKQQSNETTGLVSLFGGEANESVNVPSIADIADWSEKERLEREKEALNFYVSGHPLYRYYAQVISFATLNLSDRENPIIGSTVRVCGMIADIRTRLDKKNNTIAFVTLEDFSGKAECIFWSDHYLKFAHLLKKDGIVMIIGKSELREEELKITTEEVIPIEDTVSRFAKGYKIWLELGETNETNIRTLKEKLCGRSGFQENRILFYVSNKDLGYKTLYDAFGVSIPVNNETEREISALFGTQNVGFVV